MCVENRSHDRPQRAVTEAVTALREPWPNVLNTRTYPSHSVPKETPSTAGLLRGEQPVPTSVEPSATAWTLPEEPEEGDLGSRQLLPVSGIFWLNIDLTKPALYSCPPQRPAQGSGSLFAREWAGDQHILMGTPTKQAAVLWCLCGV